MVAKRTMSFPVAFRELNLSCIRQFSLEEVNTRYGNNTLLTTAVVNNSAEVLFHLLSIGASPDNVPHQRKTIFDYAFDGKKVVSFVVIELLLKMGARPDHTTLNIALAFRRIDIANLLLNYGCSVTDEVVKTQPLMTYCKWLLPYTKEEKKFGKRLIGRFSYHQIRSYNYLDNNWTGKEKLFRRLLEAGASVEKCSRNGKIIELNIDNLSVIEMVLKKGYTMLYPLKFCPNNTQYIRLVTRYLNVPIKHQNIKLISSSSCLEELIGYWMKGGATRDEVCIDILRLAQTHNYFVLRILVKRGYRLNPDKVFAESCYNQVVAEVEGDVSTLEPPCKINRIS